MPRLHDYLREGLDLVIVGINPGVRSWAAGRHYAGPGNHFWPLLYESGLVSEPLTSAEDQRVLEWNIGLTNMVSRMTPGVADLSFDELSAGARTLERKLVRCRPRVVCFNGKRIYDVYAATTRTNAPSASPAAKAARRMGLQPELIGDALAYVMPSTSPRGATYQRADKLRFFIELRDLVHGARPQAVAS